LRVSRALGALRHWTMVTIGIIGDTTTRRRPIWLPFRPSNTPSSLNGSLGCLAVLVIAPGGS
jgi:hypothetical protein